MKLQMKLLRSLQFPSLILKQQWTWECTRASGSRSRALQNALELQEKKREMKREMRKKTPLLPIHRDITVKELAQLSNKTIEDVHYAMKLVRKPGRSFHEARFQDLLPQIVKKLGFRPQMTGKPQTLASKVDRDIYAQPVTTDSSLLVRRPPIVAVMGHVDHGKTTLLDSLRKTSVAAGEAGGITQSIGAFSVTLSTGQTATFIDTPGHSVFTSMRERGAKVTDIVVLVVAADDGVMEQTIESINMAKMAEASIVVALNKCDKTGAQPDLVIKELENYGINCESLGGDVQAVKISALKNKGLDNLVQCIITQSELLELWSDPEMQAQGIVIESRVQKGRGAMASVIVRQGTIKKGMFLLAGTSVAKVRQLYNSSGEKINAASPGMPVDVMGWRSLPHAGQMVLGVESEAKAKQAVHQRESELKHLQSDEIFEIVEQKRNAERKEYEFIREQHRQYSERHALSYVLARDKNTQKEETPGLSIIVKADVDGSMEALMKVLSSYDRGDECRLKLVLHGIGDLTEKEIELAKEFDAMVFLFNTDISPSARALDHGDVTICKHKVIYHFVDELKARIEERLLPYKAANVLGEAEILEIFPYKEKKVASDVAGCRVLKGVMSFENMHRIIRSDEIVHSGMLKSMRQFARDVKEVGKGMECGLLFSNSQDIEIRVGDKIQCYSPFMKKAKLDWRPPGF